MATAALPDAPRIVGDIIALHADEIDASERLRPIDLGWAAALGQIMLSEGQRTPVEVCRQRGPKKWRLVAGGHRHAAASMFLDLNPIRAIEVEGGELARRQGEIAENLWRRDLSPIDRSVFIAEMYEVLRARSGLAASSSPQQIAANARWKKDLRKESGDTSEIVSRAYGFTRDIAEQIGLSRRSIELDLLLARRLSPAVREQLRGLAIADNATQLRALAKLEADEQEAVLGKLLGGTKSVSGALAEVRARPEPSPEDRRLSAFIGTFARMSLPEKKGALSQLAGMLPAGWKLFEETSLPTDNRGGGK
jgi:ParB family chromosome partitioning protein